MRGTLTQFFIISIVFYCFKDPRTRRPADQSSPFRRPAPTWPGPVRRTTAAAWWPVTASKSGRSTSPIGSSWPTSERKPFSRCFFQKNNIFFFLVLLNFTPPDFTACACPVYSYTGRTYLPTYNEDNRIPLVFRCSSYPICRDTVHEHSRFDLTIAFRRNDSFLFTNDSTTAGRFID